MYYLFIGEGYRTGIGNTDTPITQQGNTGWKIELAVPNSLCTYES